MGLEVRFTPIGYETEVSFTILDEQSNGLFLFHHNPERDIKIQLLNDDGLLSIDLSNNPFQEDEEVITDRLTGLSSEWVEFRSSGMEQTEESNTNISSGNKPGYGPDDIFVENKPFSLRQILDLINSEDIELTPDFQRNFIWDKTRQSRLIESILLGLPLPSIYLSQYADGRLTIVDGLQRLTTIKLFFENKLTLTNLEYLTDCNGKKFKQLDVILSPLRLRRFGQTQIMCFVIDYRSPSKLKFDLFRRLNTGGKPLNNPEIRNCLSKIQLQRTLKNMVTLESFRNATTNSIKDTRMDARDAALRFMYFSEQYTLANPIGNYNGEIESTLDEFTDKLNGYSDSQLRKFIVLYDTGMQNSYHLFGDYTFRKILRLGGRKTAINKLMMLTLSILLSQYERDIVSIYPSSFLKEPMINYLNEDETLLSVLSYGTNAKYNIETAFRRFKSFLNTNLN